MSITPFYAALLAVLFLVLSVRALRMRGRLRVAVGDGGEPSLLRAARVHANFAEYVPFALLLMAFTEVQGAPSWEMHLAGVVLCVGRIAHAWGVSQVRENYRFRVLGMACTIAVIASQAVVLIGTYVTARLS